jgi:predicted dehydrogenase
MNQIVESEPVRVMASGAQDVNHLDESYDGERPDILDNAYVIVEYDNGARAMLDLSMFAEATYNQEELVAVGSKGKVEAFIPEMLIRIGRRGEHFIGQAEQHHVVDPRIKFQGHHHGSSYLEHLDFIAACRSGSSASVDLEAGLMSVAVGVAAHKSIDEHRVVEMSEVL